MSFAVLSPVGEVAMQEKSLLITTLSLMLIVVIPVVIMVFAFAWKYRATNTKAKYLPNWNHSTILEIIWWGVPSIIVTILAIITWVSTQKLDPYRKLEHPAKPVEIQVIALDWKWLFFYPEYNIATVNYIKIPINRPINFRITADAPMNSFMIPQLGGQIYAMQGMETKIHLISEKIGEYDGYSANYSGHGFSGMNFKVNAGSEEDFQQWITEVKSGANNLTKELYYQHLLPPTKNNAVELYSKYDSNLYTHILKKYLMHHGDTKTSMDCHHDATYTVDEHKKDVLQVAKYYQELQQHKHH